MKKMFEETPKEVKAESEWFLLPQMWLKKWEKYCFFDLIVGDG